MKSHTQYLTFNVPTRVGFVNITEQVADAIHKSGVQEGLVLCNAMHITASVFINDDEEGLAPRLQDAGWKSSPRSTPTNNYQHNRTGEDNADAHMKRQIMGREVVVADHQRRAGFRPLGADFLR